MLEIRNGSATANSMFAGGQAGKVTLLNGAGSGQRSRASARVYARSDGHIGANADRDPLPLLVRHRLRMANDSVRHRHRDAQRVWFPEMIEKLRSQWRQDLSFDA